MLTLSSADTEARRIISGDSQLQDMTFFVITHTKKPGSMLKLNNRESVAPIAMITTIFWLWGFSYGILGTLGNQLQAILKLDGFQSLGIHASYFAGYSVSPLLIGRPVLKKWGYKSTFITGLYIYACGALIFWPSAVLTSFPAFIISNLIVGSGLGVLETAADSFISLCGPLENSEIRLNISQAIQAIATVVSTLLAKNVFFKNVTDVSSLVDVQWTYLSIAFFDVLLAAALYYLPVPEAMDKDLEELASRRRGDYSRNVLGVRVIWLTLALGTGSQYLYTAGQEVISTSFKSFMTVSDPK